MAKEIFRIGSFNLLNLVLPNHRFYGRQIYNEKTYQKKIRWISEQLDKMDCQLIGFQEVFHREALEETLKLSETCRGYHIVTANTDGELPRVALASKYEILHSEVITRFPSVLDIEGINIPLTEFSRPVLRAQVKVNEDLAITVYVVHLKSKRPVLKDGESRKNPVDVAKGQARALVRRGIEAMALREILMQDLQNRKTPVILMGDVNDTGSAVTSRIVSGEPPHRKYPQDVKKEIWDLLLYHVKDIQARRSYQDFYYTHIHNGHHEALDHLMVSEEFVQDNPDHIGRIGLVSLLNDHLVDETVSDNGVNEWQSDHGQVVATVELR